MKAIPKIEGLHVRFDPSLSHIANARGILWWKKIVVGSGFYAFPDRERMATLLHEFAHCRAFHVEKRIAALWRIFFDWRGVARLCREQEFEADAYVRSRGFGRDLVAAITRLPGKGGPFHPSPEERIARLLAPPVSK